nr:retrovirus-related Pol polyprotein from transposon TNT 1-94 [Tanacetum cinerariifolium]
MTSQSAFSFPDPSSFSTQKATFTSFSPEQTLEPNGNSKKSLGRDSKRGIIILPHVSFEKYVAVQRETKARTLLLQSLLKDHMVDFHHLDDAREIWLAVKARFGGNEESKKLRKTMLKSLEIDVKGGSSYGSRSTTVAQTHSAFIGAASTNTKMVYSDQPSYSSSITYTSAPSSSIIKDVLHSLVAENEPTQQLAYEDFEQAGKKINFNNKDSVRFNRRKARCYNCLQLGPFSRECNVKKNEHEAVNMTEEAEQVYGLMAGFESDFAVHAGNATGTVNPAVAEFAMMGISLKEYIRSDKVCDLSIPSVFDPEPENREVKSLYERFFKASKMHEVPPPITGSFMPTSYKSDLAKTQATFGSKSNTSSLNTFNTNDFVSCDNSDKSSASKTYDFTSCVSSPKTNDSFSTVDVKILPKSDVKDPSPTNGFPNCSFNENVKPARNLSSVPAGSRPSSASTSAGSSIPAASRNRPASIHAGRSIPSASRNRPTSIHAGRSIPAASRNRPASIHVGRHIPASRINKPAPFPAGRSIPTGWTIPAARPFFRPTNLYFDNTLYAMGVQEQWWISSIYMVSHLMIHKVHPHVNKYIGIIDSGCSRSMTGNKEKFDDFVQVKGGTVTFGGGDEAVSTACYVLNRVSITNPHNKTPYELLSGKVPNIRHLKPFRCQVTILNTIDYLGKFKGKSNDSFLVGYAAHSKAYRVYNLSSKKVEETLNLRYLEDKPNVQGLGQEW